MDFKKKKKRFYFWMLDEMKLEHGFVLKYNCNEDVTDLT